MKKIILSLLCLALSCGIVFSQTEAQVNSAQDLDRETQKLGASIISQLKKESGNTKPKLAVGNFIYQGFMVSLGSILNQNLTNQLSVNAANQFQIISAGAPAAPASSPAPDFIINGEITEIGNIFRLYTRLVRTRDNSIAFAWQTDFQKTAFLMPLVNVSGNSHIPMDIHEIDSMDRPVPVQINGERISRSIHSGSDEDWFVFTAPEDVFVFFRVEGADDFDSILEIYNAGRKEIANNDDYDDSYDAGIILSVKKGETIYLKVTGYDGETGFYTFGAETVRIDDQAMEPNDTMEQAFRVSPGPNPLAGFFMSAEDSDWYTITIPPEDKTLLVYTEGNLDTYITLYDETGESIAENDDAGSSYNARISTIVSGGTYYIEVEEIDGSTGPYSLYIRLNDAVKGDQYEPDNSRSSAKEIKIGVPEQRTFSDGGDEDWAWFTVPARASYTISAVGENRELDTYLELYNEQGDLVAEDDDGGNNYDALLRAELGPGKYFIRVETLDDLSGPETYTLNVSR